MLKHLESLHPPDSLSDYMLGVKTCTLVTVLSLSRSGSVAALVPGFQAVENDIVIQLLKVEKNSRPGETFISSCKKIDMMFIFTITPKPERAKADLNHPKLALSP